MRGWKSEGAGWGRGQWQRDRTRLERQGCRCENEKGYVQPWLWSSASPRRGKTRRIPSSGQRSSRRIPTVGCFWSTLLDEGIVSGAVGRRWPVQGPSVGRPPANTSARRTQTARDRHTENRGWLYILGVKGLWHHARIPHGGGCMAGGLIKIKAVLSRAPRGLDFRVEREATFLLPSEWLWKSGLELVYRHISN